ncbi:MAG: O-antigen ligase domain-containing protein [Cyanobacteria bacterium P01_A01_bin.84]
MNSDYISKLFNLILSPYSIVGLVVGLLILEKAKHSQRLSWLLFSLCCFCASLNKYEDQWVSAPPLVFPLEQLRGAGRPLTIILLGVLLLLGFMTKTKWRQIFIPEAVKYLILVQVVFFIKIIAYGDIVFAFLAGFTFAGLATMVIKGPACWLQDGKSFHLGVWSLGMVGVIFGIINTFQASINMSALTFSHGRFSGTTGNAQHAAVLLAATIPSIIFLIETNKKWNLTKLVWVGSLILVSYFLFLTGSRTGVSMAIISVLSFYRHRVPKLIGFGFIVFAIAVLVSPFLDLDTTAINAPITERYISAGNSREGAWLGLWNDFISYPLFGAPLRGGRLGFGENSWLAVGSTAGLLGFIPMLMFGFECLKMLFKLDNLYRRESRYHLQVSTVIAALASFLVGSFTEAFLLGNLTFPVMALLVYLSLGKYLLDVDRVHSQYQDVS